MFRPSPMVTWSRRQVVRGSRLQMTAWEQLYRSHGVGGRGAARVKARSVAGHAKRLGMLSADALQLMISAVDAADSGETRDGWLLSVTSGEVLSIANGINLAWMPTQFHDEELGIIGDRAIGLVGLNLDDWRSSSS